MEYAWYLGLNENFARCLAMYFLASKWRFWIDSK